MISDDINNEEFFDKLENLIKEHGIDRQAHTYAHLLSFFIGQTLDSVESLNYNRDREMGFVDYGN